MPPLSEILDVLLYAVLPALVVAAVVMAAVVMLGGAARAPLAAALGVGAAAALGLWLREGLELISSASPWNRLPPAALAALWVGRIARLPDLQPSAGCWLRAATAIGIAWLVIPAETRSEIDWLAPAFAAVVFAQWVLLERLAARVPDGSVPLCLALALLAAGAVLIHANSARLMNAAIVLASAFAGIAAVSWWRRVDAGGAVPAAGVLLPGLLLMGKQETVSEIPWNAFALPALAPLLLAEALPLAGWQGSRWQRVRFLLMVLVVLIPLAAAIYIAREAAPLDFGDS
jgi:hypothetical protein